jgi:hypothetical protein
MKTWKVFSAGLALTTGIAPSVWAQVPGVTNGSAAATQAATAAAPASSPANFWSFFCKTPAQSLACKEKLCNSPLGQLLNNGMKPMGMFSGGLLGPCCPPFNQADLLKPADSAEGAAAAIKADEADAKARRAAVRYLGTVDCHYWPEAKDALINALRADKNECVRWEAAMALNSGCCCNKATIKALTISANGTDEDDNPSETSERVRMAAMMALNHCLSCMPPVIEEKKKEGPGTPQKLPEGTSGKEAKTTMNYYKRLDQEPLARIVDDARRTLAKAHGGDPEIVTRRGGRGGRGGLFDIAAKAWDGSEVRVEESHVMVASTPPPPMVNVQQTVFQQPQPAVQVAAPAVPAPVVMQAVPAPVVMQAVPAPVVMQASETPRPTLMSKLRELRQGGSAAPVDMPALPPPAPAPEVVQKKIVPVPAVQASYTVVEEKKAPTVYPTATQVSRTEVANKPTKRSPGDEHSVSRLLAVLHHAADSNDRLWAACQLTRVDWRTTPQVVTELLTAAKQDSVGIVRVTCIRCLEVMEVNTPHFLATLESMKNDRDPYVKRAVDEVLIKLHGTSASAGNRVARPMAN